MNFHFLRWGVTLSGHVYDRRQLHDCNVLDCPQRRPAPDTRVVIADRLVGRYSEQFSTRHDAEVAISFLIETGARQAHRFQILDAPNVMGVPMIGDPALPPDMVYFVQRKPRFQYEQIPLDPDA